MAGNNFQTAPLRLFGDGHTGFFAGRSDIVPCHVGPVTMFRVGRDGPDLFGLTDRGIVDGDPLGFLFGEIDVRVHIHQQVMRGRTEDEVLTTLADAYLRTLERIHIRYPGSPITLVSISPPAGRETIGTDARYPRNGADAERVRWTLLLNAKLMHGAQQRGFRFMDQYTRFADAAGLLRADATTDGTHIAIERAGEIDMQSMAAWRPVDRKTTWLRRTASALRKLFA